MKNSFFVTIFFVFLISFLCFGTMLYASGSSSKAQQTTYSMHKGINISTWLVFNASTNSSELAQYFTRENFDELVSMGFDHFRLPFNEKTLYKSISPIERDTGNFSLVHNFIGWCEEAGVTVALNYHISRTSKSILGADNETGAAERAKMVNAWDDLSLAFNSYSNETLAYEIFNEPNFSSDSVWNVFANTMIGKIREREPERIIILGPNGDNSISKLTALSLPADKTNLIVSVHFYAPAALTHYNTGGLYGIFVQLNYPGQIFTSSALAELTQEERDKIKVHSGNFTIATQKTRLQPVLDFAATKNVRIRCGEYGCNNQYEIAYNDKDIKLRYFQDIVQVFDDLNIPHCVWGYKATFGLFNEAGELNDPRVVNAITGYDITTVSEYAVNSLPMKLYPVPSKTKEIISIETDFLQDAIIDMFNLSGVKIKSVELSEPVTKIVMPETPGVYLLVIKSENETVKSVKITVF